MHSHIPVSHTHILYNALAYQYNTSGGSSSIVVVVVVVVVVVSSSSSGSSSSSSSSCSSSLAYRDMINVYFWT